MVGRKGKEKVVDGKEMLNGWIAEDSGVHEGFADVGGPLNDSSLLGLNRE